MRCVAVLRGATGRRVRCEHTLTQLQCVRADRLSDCLTKDADCHTAGITLKRLNVPRRSPNTEATAVGHRQVKNIHRVPKNVHLLFFE